MFERVIRQTTDMPTSRGRVRPCTNRHGQHSERHSFCSSTTIFWSTRMITTAFIVGTVTLRSLAWSSGRWLVAAGAWRECRIESYYHIQDAVFDSGEGNIRFAGCIMFITMLCAPLTGYESQTALTAKEPENTRGFVSAGENTTY